MTPRVLPPLNDRQLAIIAYLREHPNVTAAEIARAVGCTTDRARDCLAGLYTRGLVGRQKSMFDVEQTTWSAGQPVEAGVQDA